MCVSLIHQRLSHSSPPHSETSASHGGDTCAYQHVHGGLNAQHVREPSKHMHEHRHTHTHIHIHTHTHTHTHTHPAHGPSRDSVTADDGNSLVELEADDADGGRVHTRRELLDVVDEHAVEEGLVSILQRLKLEASRDVRRTPVQHLGLDLQRLFLATAVHTHRTVARVIEDEKVPRAHATRTKTSFKAR